MCRGKRSQFFSAIACGEGPFFYVISACNSIKISRFRKGKILLERSLKLISSNVFRVYYLLCLVDVHSYGYQLRSSSRRLVLLFVWSRLHTWAFRLAFVCPSINGFWLPLWYLQTFLRHVGFQKFNMAEQSFLFSYIYLSYVIPNILLLMK